MPSSTALSHRTHCALEQNLKTRVCEIAGTTSNYLTPDAVAFLERRTSKWLVNRDFKEADLQKAGKDMKRRYPKAFPAPGELEAAKKLQQQNIKSGAAGSMRPSQVETRSATTEPQSSLGGASTMKNKRKSSNSTQPTTKRSSSVAERRAGAGSAEAEESSPSRDTCRRPQVIQRMQRLNADKEWHLAAQEDARIHDEAKAKLLEERVSKQIAVRRDMQEAEQYRELRKEQERKEREENRQTVIRVIQEVKQHERDIDQQRRNKFAREKKFIEDQRETRRSALEQRQKVAKIDNERLRKQMHADIESHTQQEYEKAVAVRDSLLEFLDQSKEHLALKRQREEELKMRDREHDRANAQGGGGTLDRGDQSAAKVRQKAEQRIKARRVLQEKVGEIYVDLAAQDRQKRALEEDRLQQQVRVQQAEVEQRARRDAEKAAKMRQQLVSSLDIEIGIHHKRKEDEENEKIKLRKLVDEKTKKEEVVAREEKSQSRVRQAKLLDDIDEQLNERFESMLKPQKIKI